MPIDIKSFSGMSPSTAKQSLPDTMATVALNCRLGSMELRPCAKMRPDHVIDSTVRSLYRHDGVWVERAEAGYRFVPGPVDTTPQRLYMTLPGGGGHCWVAGAETLLGVVPPAVVPGASASGGTGIAETRVYLFTCVSEYGEESAPSPPSNSVDVLPGGSVSITGMVSPDSAGHAAVTKKRIYRSAVGTSGSAGYFFVDEIDSSLTTYSDTVLSTALGEALPSLGWALPPSGLKGLTSMPGGFLAGFSGRDVRLCEPWQPHAWPDSYSNTIQHDIVQLVSSGRTLFILTTGPVYFMTVNDISSAVPEIMAGDVPAVSANAVVSTPAGGVFASKDGLYILVPGATAPTLLTRGFYSELDWQRMSPASMFGAWHADQLFMFYTDSHLRRGGMVFDSIMTDTPVLRLTDIAVDSATVVPDGRLLFVVSGGYVQEWEGDSSFMMDTTWASKEFVAASPLNFSAAIVEADYNTTPDPDEMLAELVRRLAAIQDANFGSIVGAIGLSAVGFVPNASDLMGTIAPFFALETYVGNTVEFKIWGDSVLRYTHISDSEVPFVLPSGYQARRWTVQVKANVPVKRIAVGESVEDIYS